MIRKGINSLWSDRMDDLARYRSIRDAAAVMLHQVGHVSQSQLLGRMRVRQGELGDLVMIYSAAPVPEPEWMQRTTNYVWRLPYALEMLEHGRLVFSVGWNLDDTVFCKTRFEDGHWVDRLLAHRARQPLR